VRSTVLDFGPKVTVAVILFTVPVGRRVR